MKLVDYLERADITPQEFAAQIGVSAEAVRLYIRGERRPRSQILQAIQSKTDGAVTPNDFYPAEANS